MNLHDIIMHPQDLWDVIWRRLLIGGGGGKIRQIVSGISPITLTNIARAGLIRITQMGKTEQTSTPTPSSPQDIRCNNGVLKAVRESGLPLRYQQVEWLKATQPTDMGIKTKRSFDIYSKVYREGTVAQFIYQSDSGASLTTNTTAYTSTGGANWRFGNRTGNVQLPVEEIVETRQNRDGVWVNNEQIVTYQTVNAFTSENNFAIAGATSGGASPTLRIHYVRILDGDDLVLDCVPVRDLTDNSLGWYDKVSQTFYTNSDSDYTAGSNVADPISVVADGTDEVLTVGGGQMLDPTTVPDENRYILSGTGAVNSTTPTTGTFRHSDFIPVVGGVTYKLGIVYFTANAAGLAWYSAADVSGYVSGVSGTAIGAADGIVTAPASAKYVRFSWHTDEGYDADWEHSVYLCRVINGTPALAEWQPYVTPQTASVKNLLGVGDYKDTQDIISGAIERKVGVKVFDGTETNGWTISSTRVYALKTLLDMKDAKSNSPILCNISSNSNTTINSYGNVLIYANWSAESITTAAELNAYLAAQYAAGTPVIVVYPLAEPTTESVQGHHFTVGDSAIITAESDYISDINLEVEYWEQGE